jgi:pimeloyl-ACP methyl ester carboxylesterase
MAETLRLEGSAREDKVSEIFSHWLSQRAVKGEGIGEGPDTTPLDFDGRETVAKLQRLGRRRRGSVATVAQKLRDETTFVQDLSTIRPLEDGELANITAPVLALYGADSELRPDGDRLAQHLPHCLLRIIPHCGHGILFHAATAVKEATQSWMDEVGL